MMVIAITIDQILNVNPLLVQIIIKIIVLHLIATLRKDRMYFIICYLELRFIVLLELSQKSMSLVKILYLESRLKCLWSFKFNNKRKARPSKTNRWLFKSFSNQSGDNFLNDFLINYFIHLAMLKFIFKIIFINNINKNTINKNTINNFKTRIPKTLPSIN